MLAFLSVSLQTKRLFEFDLLYFSAGNSFTVQTFPINVIFMNKKIRKLSIAASVSAKIFAQLI